MSRVSTSSVHPNTRTHFYKHTIRSTKTNPIHNLNRIKSIVRCTAVNRPTAPARLAVLIYFVCGLRTHAHTHTFSSAEQHFAEMRVFARARARAAVCGYRNGWHKCTYADLLTTMMGFNGWQSREHGPRTIQLTPHFPANFPPVRDRPVVAEAA